MMPMGSARQRCASINWSDSLLGRETEIAIWAQSLVVLSENAIVHPLENNVLGVVMQPYARFALS